MESGGGAALPSGTDIHWQKYFVAQFVYHFDADLNHCHEVVSGRAANIQTSFKERVIHVMTAATEVIVGSAVSNLLQRNRTLSF